MLRVSECLSKIMGGVMVSFADTRPELAPAAIAAARRGWSGTGTATLRSNKLPLASVRTWPKG